MNDRTPTRHLAIAVGLLALVGALTEVAAHYRPHSFILRDGRFYTNTMATLTDSLSLEQPYARSWYGGDLGWNRNLDAGWSNIALGRNGEGSSASAIYAESADFADASTDFGAINRRPAILRVELTTRDGRKHGPTDLPVILD